MFSDILKTLSNIKSLKMTVLGSISVLQFKDGICLVSSCSYHRAVTVEIQNNANIMNILYRVLPEFTVYGVTL